jgi:hypothetical protein
VDTKAFAIEMRTIIELQCQSSSRAQDLLAPENSNGATTIRANTPTLPQLETIMTAMQQLFWGLNDDTAQSAGFGTYLVSADDVWKL